MLTVCTPWEPCPLDLAYRTVAGLWKSIAFRGRAAESLRKYNVRSCTGLRSDNCLLVLFSDDSLDIRTRHLFGLDNPVSGKGVDAE